VKIFLAGNPNVGKSVLFNRLTSTEVRAHAFVSNYPGTTVDYFVSSTQINGKKAEVIDLPGVYSLRSTNEAEEVALKILKDCGTEDVVINVIDATRMRNGLFLTLDLIEKGYPLLIAVNMMDMAEKRGIEIDLNTLESIMQVPVVGTVAIRDVGVDKLISRIEEKKVGNIEELANECRG
jgi:ferrous iron transport protein B